MKQTKDDGRDRTPKLTRHPRKYISACRDASTFRLRSTTPISLVRAREGNSVKKSAKEE